MKKSVETWKMIVFTSILMFKAGKWQSVHVVIRFQGRSVES